MATPCVAVAGAVPAKIPFSQHNPDMVKLDSETRLIIHTIRMAACNAETILARALNGPPSRVGHEAYVLIREALTASGDIKTYAPICRDARKHPVQPDLYRNQVSLKEPHPLTDTGSAACETRGDQSAGLRTCKHSGVLLFMICG